MLTDTPQISWEMAVQTLRDDPASQDIVQACFYDDPLAEAAKRYWNSSEWNEVRSRLPAVGGDALDIGAGRGIAAYALARDGWNTSALEPDSSDIVGAGAIRQLAAAENLSIDIFEEWGEKLPFAEDSFDIVHCRAVLHHARDLLDLCKEVSRVLRPGGTFIATREHVVSRHEDIPTFQASHPLHDLYGGEYAYTLQEYKNAITSAGLQIVSVLNPFASNINLYPVTMQDVKRRWSSRLKLPLPALIPDFALKMRGRTLNTPGRLYTFVSRLRS